MDLVSTCNVVPTIVAKSRWGIINIFLSCKDFATIIRNWSDNDWVCFMRESWGTRLAYITFRHTDSRGSIDCNDNNCICGRCYTNTMKTHLRRVCNFEYEYVAKTGDSPDNFYDSRRHIDMMLINQKPDNCRYCSHWKGIVQCYMFRSNITRHHVHNYLFREHQNLVRQSV